MASALDRRVTAAAAALLDKLRAKEPAILMAEHVASRIAGCSVVVEIRFSKRPGHQRKMPTIAGRPEIGNDFISVPA